MAYVGATPAKIPLTSSDLADSIVTAPKIATDAVIAAKIATNAVEEAKVNADAITSAKIAAGAIVDSDINASAAIGNTKLANYQITIDGAAISLGGSVSTGTYPTFTSVTPSTVTNDLTSIVIVGTNFGGSGIPAVEFQNSTGSITAASSVTRNSTTQLTVGCTLPTDGTYYIRIELNSGLAVRTTNAELTVSDAPVWTTAAGSLGTIAGDFSGTAATVAATGDGVEFTETTSVLTNASLANCSLNSATGAITTTDFGGDDTESTTFTFTIRATDDQAQTADREFTLTSSYGGTGGGQFN